MTILSHTIQTPANTADPVFLVVHKRAEHPPLEGALQPLSISVAIGDDEAMRAAV